MDRGECCGVERNEARGEFWSCCAFIEREGVKFHHDFIVQLDRSEERFKVLQILFVVEPARYQLSHRIKGIRVTDCGLHAAIFPHFNPSRIGTNVSQ